MRLSLRWTGPALATALMLAGCFGGDVSTSGAGDVERVSLDASAEANIIAIGIYEHANGRGINRSTPLPVTVSKAEGPAIRLALSAYEPIEWQIGGPGAARVEAVYLDGFYTQSVSGLPLGTRTVNKSGHAHRGRGSASAGWGSPKSSGSQIAEVDLARSYDSKKGKAFVSNAETLLEGRVRSFTGTYYVEGFSIDY